MLVVKGVVAISFLGRRGKSLVEVMEDLSLKLGAWSLELGPALWVVSSHVFLRCRF
jgi:hypothetical protein